MDEIVHSVVKDPEEMGKIKNMLLELDANMKKTRSETLKAIEEYGKIANSSSE